jgi:hypothetical protein
MTSILPWLLIIIALGVLLWTAIRARRGPPFPQLAPCQHLTDCLPNWVTRQRVEPLSSSPSAPAQ